jgi:glycosyltransferase involved in cell wall biosynthesis
MINPKTRTDELDGVGFAMKILMIGPSRDVKGGISTVVNNYYAAGLDKKVDVTYLRTMVDGTKLTKLIVAGAAFMAYLWKIRSVDLLHVHMSSRASFYRKSGFIQVARRLNKKIVIHLHGSEFQEFYLDESNDRQKAYIEKIFSYADRVIALSGSWKSFLSTFVNRDNIDVVYNCVPVPPDFTKDHSSMQMLFLGRIGKRKGVFDLMKIMPEVARQISGCQTADRW